MARLPRVTSKVFAENATEVGQFGSLNAGTKVTTTDIATIQGLQAWQDGWEAATLGANCYPTLQERNGLDKVQSYMINYLYQEGVPEWDAGTTYYTGSIVKLINGTAVQFYKSLIDNNTNSLSDTASWEETLISGANKDLSNLSVTGVNNLIQYAHELDLDNAIIVSTTNSNTYQSYTATTDGILTVYAYATSSANNAAYTIAAIYDTDIEEEIILNINFSTNIRTSYNSGTRNSAYFPILKNQTLYFRIYSQGNSSGSVSAKFIPYKKSL